MMLIFVMLTDQTVRAQMILTVCNHMMGSFSLSDHDFLTNKEKANCGV